MFQTIESFNDKEFILDTFVFNDDDDDDDVVNDDDDDDNDEGILGVTGITRKAIIRSPNAFNKTRSAASASNNAHSAWLQS